MKSSPARRRRPASNGGESIELRGGVFALTLIAVLVLLTLAAPIVMLALAVERAARRVGRRVDWPLELLAACTWATRAAVAHRAARVSAAVARAWHTPARLRHP